MLSVIIPTYNEADNVAELIERIERSLNGRSFEIIVVDDNSPDGTAKIVEGLGKDHIKVLKRPKKLGLASAILDGMKVADGNIIAVMDADLQHPPELLPELLKKVEDGYDIAIASRYVDGGKVEEWSFFRKLISKGAIFLSHALFPRTRQIKDVISGYFAFRRSVLDGVKLNPIGYKLLLEILVKGKYDKVIEIPYTFKPRKKGKSKIGLNEIINYVKHLFRLSEYRALKFMIVGAFGVVVNVGILHFLVSLGVLPLFLASPIAIEASILSNFMLNDIWTFRDRKFGSVVTRCLKYHCAMAFGSIINYVTLLALVSFGMNYLLANLIGIFLGFIANYMASEEFVWKQ